MAHLDRPYGDWVRSVTATPANAMGLRSHGRLKVGGPADFVIFRARRYSELLSRPQLDRVVVRNGKALVHVVPPDYSELDYVPEAIKSGDVAVMEVGGEGQSTTRLGAPFSLSANGSGSGAAGYRDAKKDGELSPSSRGGTNSLSWIVMAVAVLMAFVAVFATYAGPKLVPL